MTDKLYIVGEVGFEYNDEIYRANDSNAVTPQAAYRTKANAELAAAELTIAHLLNAGTNLGYYGYDTADVFKDVSIAQAIISKYDPEMANELEDEFYCAMENFSDIAKQFAPDELRAFIDNLELKFYQVYEVELGEDMTE